MLNNDELLKRIEMLEQQIKDLSSDRQTIGASPKEENQNMSKFRNYNSKEKVQDVVDAWNELYIFLRTYYTFNSKVKDALDIIKTEVNRYTNESGQKCDFWLNDYEFIQNGSEKPWITFVSKNMDANGNYKQIHCIAGYSTYKNAKSESYLLYD